MAYTKTTWKDLPDTTTPVNATNMNKIEDELSSLDTQVSTNTSDISTNTSNISKLTPTILYTSSGTTGDITLSDSAVNYSFLVVHWTTSYNGLRRGATIAPNNNLFTLFSLDVDVNTYTNVYTNCALYNISGTSFQFLLAKNYASTNVNPFSINQIVGYK